MCNAISIFSKLPDTMIHIILSYTGKISYRNGHYINKLDKNDDRYELLESIQLKEYNKNTKYYSVELTIFNDDDIVKYFVLASDFFQNKERIYLLKMISDDDNNWHSDGYNTIYL